MWCVVIEVMSDGQRSTFQTFGPFHTEGHACRYADKFMKKWRGHEMRAHCVRMSEPSDTIPGELFSSSLGSCGARHDTNFWRQVKADQSAR